ncbi:hypothetical protein GYMLUDRAFT_261029 [Collybiopsis luxurians FD-317 M1]|uniref:F-box domain-containing protein n=1 Tax=Collybiopsis luxurians FD-317 M1 TaxID=944289 RepID=A0A0D0CQ29_9AGAR|nr:hypothetical protein GYMLUDRAFT_261029 [Collybiopsis luxurians FD-317 M1]
MASLPQEIIDAIVDIIEDHFPTLASVSRISKVFLPRCRKHILASALLSPSTAKFYLLNPHLIPFIQHLLVRGHSFSTSKYPERGGLLRKDLAAICQFLRSLPTLQTLYLLGIKGLSINDVLAMGGRFKRPIAMRLLRSMLNALLPEGMNKEKPLRTFEVILYYIAHCIDARSIEFGNSILTLDELYAFLRTFPSLSSVHFNGRTQVIKSDSFSTSLLSIRELHMLTYYSLAPNVLDVFNSSKIRSLSLRPVYSRDRDVPYREGLKAITEGCRSHLSELCISLTSLDIREVKQFCSDIRFRSFPDLDTLTLTIDTRNMENFGKLGIMLKYLTSRNLHLRTLELKLVLFNFIFQASFDSISEVQELYPHFGGMTRERKTLCAIGDTSIFDNTEKIVVSMEFLIAPILQRKDRELLRHSVVEYMYLSVPLELRGRPNFKYSWNLTYYDPDPVRPAIPDLTFDA